MRILTVAAMALMVFVSTAVARTNHGDFPHYGGGHHFGNGHALYSHHSHPTRTHHFKPR